ncbi:hypothetical protein [Planctomycetes bacterium CA13]|uniref:hypothetical protein n=1 Tax=Novipirellula herctigrandis TaxID=2527986 RepID=UPI0011B85971
MACTLKAAETELQPPVNLRLELSWTTELANRWRIQVEVVDRNGTAILSELENRCQEPTVCGAFQLNDDASSWTFSPRFATGNGGARFQVTASDAAELVVRVDSFDAATTPDDSQSVSTGMVTRIPLQKLISETVNSQTDPTWVLRRVANDSVRVSFADPSIIRQPGTPIETRVVGNALVEGKSKLLHLVSSIIRASDGKVVSTQTDPFEIDSQGNSKPVTVANRCPTEPGVYELRYEVTNEDRLWSRLRRREDSVVRVARPIVVLPETTPVGGEIAFESWPTISHLKLTNTTDWAVPQFFSFRTIPLLPSPLLPDKTLSETRLDSEPAEFPEGMHEGEKTTMIPPSNSFETALKNLRIGYPHHITIRYPANQSLHLRIQIANRRQSFHECHTDYVIQDERHAVDPQRSRNPKWLTQSILYYPQGQDRIRVSNIDPSDSAAIESIEIKSGPANLAASNFSPEKDAARASAIRLNGFDWVHSFSDTLEHSSLTTESIELYRLYVATERISQYAAVLGADTLLVSANEDGRTWFPTSQFASSKKSSDLEDQYLDVVLSLMDRFGCQVVIALEPNMTLRRAETSGESHSRAYRFVDPIVSESVLAITDEMIAVAKPHRCFGGMAISCGKRSHCRPIPTTSLPNDEILQAFAQSVDQESLTLEQLKTWISQTGFQTYCNWAINLTRKHYEAIAARCDAKALWLVDLPESELVTNNASAMVDSSWPDASTHSNIVPVATQFRGAYSSLSKQLDTEKLVAQQTTSLEPLSGRIGVAIRSSTSADYPTSAMVDRILGVTLNHAINQLDPKLIVIDYEAIQTSLSDGLRTAMFVMGELSSSPMKEFASADPVTQTVRVQWGMENGHIVLLISNNAPWPSELELRCRKPVRWQDPSDLQKSFAMSDDNLVTRIGLHTGELKVVRSAQTELPENVLAWSSRVQGGAEGIEQIKADVTTVVEKLGTLSDSEPYDALSNGGFEDAGGVGITGWMHAQYPAGSVTTDSHESIEGKQSLCMTTDGQVASQTWLVSETIAPPASGRLAVAMACRAKASEVTTPHKLRVSVEGTDSGASFRYSQEVELPRNGQWQPRKILSEAASLDASKVESLRITIDSLSPGKIWIDDVRLHDFFPTSKERTELQTQAFLAVQGLQRGNLEPSARLLKNRWARVLIQTASVAKVKAPTNAETDQVAPDETHGVAQRIRNWLPRPMRF